MTFDPRLDLTCDQFVALQMEQHHERLAARKRKPLRSPKVPAARIVRAPRPPRVVVVVDRALKLKERKRRRTQRRKAKACSSVSGIEMLKLDPCSYCDDPHPTTHDHIIPFSKGGAHDLSNLTRSCRRCNFKKGTKSLLVFLATRQERHHGVSKDQ